MNTNDIEPLDYESRERQPKFGDADWKPPLAVKMVLISIMLMGIAAPAWLVYEIVIAFVHPQ